MGIPKWLGSKPEGTTVRACQLGEVSSCRVAEQLLCKFRSLVRYHLDPKTMLCLFPCTFSPLSISGIQISQFLTHSFSLPCWPRDTTYYKSCANSLQSFFFFKSLFPFLLPALLPGRIILCTLTSKLQLGWRALSPTLLSSPGVGDSGIPPLLRPASMSHPTTTIEGVLTFRFFA